MNTAGFELLGHKDCLIAPVLIGDAHLAKAFAESMSNEGIHVVGFSYPMVPLNKARIRVAISAAHSPEHIECAIRAFIKVGRSFNLIPKIQPAFN